MEYASAIPSQVMQIPIILGDTSTLADSIYGVAFTILYDQTMTDSNSVSVDFGTSWLGTINTDMIAVQKDFYHQGQIDVAVVRTDQTNRSNIGQIGSLMLTIKDDILKSTTLRLDLQISNVRIITNMETEKTANTPPTDILITIASTVNNLEQEDININVFPNPAKTEVLISSNDEIQQILLYNTSGQLIQSSDSKRYNSKIDVQNLNSGIYFLRVQTLHGFSTQKIQVVR